MPKCSQFTPQKAFHHTLTLLAQLGIQMLGSLHCVWLRSRWEDQGATGATA
ncbi:MAG: hypothetical protein ACKN81_15590 [Pirellulaceae bacterium]